MSMLDDSTFPLVRWTTPSVVSEEEGAAALLAFDAILEREKRFVILFDGAERPENSPAFMRAYKAWFAARRPALKSWVAGAVRIEPEAARRSSMLAKALNVAMLAFLPYPFRVAADEAEARAIASTWLGGPP